MSQKLLVIKKIKKAAAHQHHGGSWKVAYADFTTAMMAFFLLLWLVTMVTPEKRARVAHYFREFSLFEPSGESILEGKQGITGYGDTSPPMEIPKDTQATPRVGKSAFAERLKLLVEEKLADVKDQVIVEVTKEGVKVQIVDKEGTPIFPLGSSQLSPKAKEIMRVLNQAIKDVGNPITIDGHTDALSYSTSKYTNWELSTDRASSARRELEQHGLNPDLIARVAGFAATEPLIKENPNDPRNRRISITILFPMEKVLEGP